MAALAVSAYALFKVPHLVQVKHEKLLRQYDSLETRTQHKTLEASNELVTLARNDIMNEVGELLQTAEERFNTKGGRMSIPQASFRNL